MSSTGADVGGVVGYIYGAYVYAVKNSGSVSGAQFVGGIVGYGRNTISLAVNSGSVTATGSDVGGIGYINSSTVEVAYAINSGAVSGTDNVGGIRALQGVTRNVISTGSVEATVGNNAGPIWGTTGGSVLANAYYYSGAACNDGDGCNAAGTPDGTLSNFYSASAPPLSSWDFIGSTADGYSNLWHEVSDDYPKLWWEQDYTQTFSFSGDGTVGTPYQIATANHVREIASNPALADSYFEVQVDIDVGPLGNLEPLFKDVAFRGDFNGQGHVISNYTFTSTTANGAGFFGTLGTPANITNLELQSLSVTALRSTGGLAGQAYYGGTIDKVSVDAASSVDGGSNTDIGGLIGLTDATISKSWSGASVNGDRNVGGLVGEAFSGLGGITDSYATGDVTCTSYGCGGFVGYWAGIMARCYASGNVTSTGGSAGGFTGRGGGANLTDSFSTGDVTGVSNGSNEVGLFKGYDGTTPPSVYVSSDATVTNTGTGGATNTDYTGTNTLMNFYSPTTAPMNGVWDFGTVWQDNSGITALPTLK